MAASLIENLLFNSKKNIMLFECSSSCISIISYTGKQAMAYFVYHIHCRTLIVGGGWGGERVLLGLAREMRGRRKLRIFIIYSPVTSHLLLEIEGT